MAWQCCDLFRYQSVALLLIQIPEGKRGILCKCLHTVIAKRFPKSYFGIDRHLNSPFLNNCTMPQSEKLLLLKPAQVEHKPLTKGVSHERVPTR